MPKEEGLRIVLEVDEARVGYGTGMRFEVGDLILPVALEEMEMFWVDVCEFANLLHIIQKHLHNAKSENDEHRPCSNEATASPPFYGRIWLSQV